MKKIILCFSCLAIFTLTLFAEQQKSTEESIALFRVEVNDKWGYIDKTGKIIITPQFDEARTFSEGLAAVATIEKLKSNADLVNRKWSYINMTGKIVIDQQFSWAGDFSEGLAPVGIEEVGEEKETGHSWTRRLMGYINKTGEVLIKPQFEAAGNFSNGLARVGILDGESYKGDGYIDKTGKLVWEPVK
ncbi:MAG: WG repeat-containing protein [Elusimicrobiota bacterium]